MREILAPLLIGSATVVFIVWATAWLTILPTLGLLWVIGVLK